MSKPIIELSGISKRYQLGTVGAKSLHDEFQRIFGLNKGKAESAPTARRDFWALRDVSAEIQMGDLVGIVGSNGAGKSTLLKILSRITTPTDGYAKVRGRVASLLEVGTGFHPELTGRENIMLNGVILGMKRWEVQKHLDEIIDFAQIDDFIDTPVKRYSSGMYVRLAFAVAAHLEPEVLIVDEVLAVGDHTFQAKCMGKMQNVAQSGRTILFVSHNHQAVARLCNTGLYLKAGRSHKYGPIQSVLDAYLATQRRYFSSREWTRDSAPTGTDGIRLLKVSAIAESADEGPSPGYVEIQQPITCRVVFETIEPHARVRICLNLWVRDELSFCLIQPSEEEYDVPGTYEASVSIPANFLSEYEYIISVSFMRTVPVKTTVLNVPDAISIQVVDELKGGSARGDYTGNYWGLLRPKLPWLTRGVAPLPEEAEPPVSATPEPAAHLVNT